MRTLESRHSCIHKIFVCNVARVSFSIIWIVNFYIRKVSAKAKAHHSYGIRTDENFEKCDAFFEV